jgi:hypothetical protein
MKKILLSATLIGAALMVAGPACAQNVGKGTDSNTTTGLSSANKERTEAGASPAGSNTRSTAGATSTMSHDEPTTGLSSAKKEREEAGASNK